MTKPYFIASACLAGLPCRYDGASKPCQTVMELYETGKILTVCPESLGGLKIPRLPCEQKGTRVMCKNGEDMTEAFYLGATKALEIALKSGCRRVIVKSRSPSCGYGQIYDGSFGHVLCAGNGICTNILLANGFEIFTEENLPP